MNETTLNIYNATAFPLASDAYWLPWSDREAQEISPVAAALSREFGRLALLLVVTFAVIIGIALVAAQSHRPATRNHAAQNSDVPTMNVASVTHNPPLTR